MNVSNDGTWNNNLHIIFLTSENLKRHSRKLFVLLFFPHSLNSHMSDVRGTNIPACLTSVEEDHTCHISELLLIISKPASEGKMVIDLFICLVNIHSTDKHDVLLQMGNKRDVRVSSWLVGRVSAGGGSVQQSST